MVTPFFADVGSPGGIRTHDELSLTAYEAATCNHTVSGPL